MNIQVICVGSIKDYYNEVIMDYVKRISKFANIRIIEIKEEKLSKNYSDKDIEIVKQKEGERILEQTKGHIILLDLLGEMSTSVELSNKFQNIMQHSSNISFIIGGSYGVSDVVKSKVNEKISFSKMTFPHQLFRVMLLEQIYRSFTILNNITYHK